MLLRDHFQLLDRFKEKRVPITLAVDLSKSGLVECERSLATIRKRLVTCFAIVLVYLGIKAAAFILILLKLVLS